MASESWLGRKLNPEPQLEPGEQIIWKRPAVTWRDPRVFGGTLYLTDRNLIFKSNRLNLPKILAQETHSLARILQVELADRTWRRSGGGFHRRIRVVHANGTSTMFGVSKGLLDETIADLSMVIRKS
jgi:hypothetical protein